MGPLSNQILQGTPNASSPHHSKQPPTQTAEVTAPDQQASKKVQQTQGSFSSTQNTTEDQNINLSHLPGAASLQSMPDTT